MTSRPKKETPTLLGRLARFCAYQDRSHLEVRRKLLDLGARGQEVEDVIAELITQGFLNEERFARSFAGGKFRMKKWGRNKIVHELEMHGVTQRCIDRGLKEIDEREYAKTLRSLLIRKWKETKEPNLFRRKNLVARYLIGKGYEPDRVWDLLKELASDD